MGDSNVNQIVSEGEPSLTKISIDKPQKNASLDLATLKVVLPKAFSLIINLFSVYFFEYAIIGCFADRIGIKVADKHPD